MGDPFSCPPEAETDVRNVMAGEYDITGLEWARPPTILDIGANVGAYARWALQRWPGSRVICYEPHPRALGYLRKNVPEAEIHPLAVRRTEGRSALLEGLHTFTCASFFDLGQQSYTTINVEHLAAEKLPCCDIMKVDTEGCELEIIMGYPPEHLPRVISFEFHRELHRVQLDNYLRTWGYKLVRGIILDEKHGTLSYVDFRRMRAA